MGEDVCWSRSRGRLASNASPTEALSSLLRGVKGGSATKVGNRFKLKSSKTFSNYEYSVSRNIALNAEYSSYYKLVVGGVNFEKKQVGKKLQLYL